MSHYIPLVYGIWLRTNAIFPKLFDPWWRHQMETFSALLAFWAGNSPVPGEFPSQRPVTRSFDISFDLCLIIHGCANNCKAGDSIRHRAHYDVTVMLMSVRKGVPGNAMSYSTNRHVVGQFLNCKKVPALALGGSSFTKWYHTYQTHHAYQTCQDRAAPGIKQHWPVFDYLVNC